MTLPNFLVIGAAKAGTSSLYTYLRAHPEIFMPEHKELNHFVYSGTGGDHVYPAKTREAYEAFFASAAGETAIGEASPRYFRSRLAAERIRETLPEAKLILSLRNPVDRAYSSYQMALRNGQLAEMPFGEAIVEKFNRGYAEPLERWFGLFGRDRIAIVMFEDIVRRPVQTVQELYGFLGVRTDFEPEIEVANPGGLPKNRLLHNVLMHRRVKKLGRKLAPRGALNAAKEVRSRNLVKQRMTAEERAKARAIFHDDILKTQDLLGRDLSAWLR